MEQIELMKKWVELCLVNDLVLKHDFIVRDVSGLPCTSAHAYQFHVPLKIYGKNHGWGALLPNEYEVGGIQIRRSTRRGVTSFKQFKEWCETKTRTGRFLIDQFIQHEYSK